MSSVVIFHLYFNKQSLPEDQSKRAPLVSLTDHPITTLVCYKYWAVVVHAFNPSTREEYKTGGNNSQTQAHSEIPGGRIAILD